MSDLELLRYVINNLLTEEQLDVIPAGRRYSIRHWLDPIQNNCKHGYVLPDRCRYTRHLGCDCGAYPPIKEPVNG